MKKEDRELRTKIIGICHTGPVTKKDAIDAFGNDYSEKAIHREFWRLVHDKFLIPQDEPFTFLLSDFDDVERDFFERIDFYV